jgi:glutaredoxin
LHKLTFYTRVNCHLCDEVKDVLDRVRARVPFELDTFDVDADPELKALYDWEVPVVMLDGKKWAKYRVDEQALIRRLETA